MFDPVEWIRRQFQLEVGSSAACIYSTQATLSFGHMPGIYRPWDTATRLHWRLRGRILDWAHVMAGRRVLDFGPGEGYPSLLLAPFVKEVIGVDGSARRVAECTENAARLRISNARFVHVPPGQPLPLEESSLDGAVASWSLEQSPDLSGTLHDIHRVLRPGGIFRFEPETLGRYAGWQERQVWLPGAMGGFSGVAVFVRDLASQRVQHIGLMLDPGKSDKTGPILEALARTRGSMPPLEVLTEPALESLRPFVGQALAWDTEHPSFEVWPQRLRSAGFARAVVTYGGGWMAERLYGVVRERPEHLGALDALLGPACAAVSEMLAPVPPPSEDYLMITAVKAE